ncbi:unnamed protein product [Sphagnum troendelagicum]|uniref:Uncharacterized protein n=1 Tax=Sphagnum troendelagicum TaxID=128251 RepID=A0ABP0TTL9_9BRYO
MSGSEQVQSVEVEKTASPSLPPAAAAAAASSSSCRKKKSDTTSTTFFGDVVDHIDEFVHASMDEHKDCLKKTLNKMFGMSKAVASGAGTTNSSAPVENLMSRPATSD